MVRMRACSVCHIRELRADISVDAAFHVCKVCVPVGRLVVQVRIWVQVGASRTPRGGLGLQYKGSWRFDHGLTPSFGDEGDISNPIGA